MSDKNYNDFAYSKGVIFQTKEWLISNEIDEYGEIVKKDKFSNIKIGGRYVIFNKYLYFPKGPLISANCNYNDFTLFLNEVGLCAKENNRKFARFELSEFEAFSDKLVSYFKKYGATQIDEYKFMNFSYIINIKNLDINKYLEKIPSKTRYNINYAIRNGIKVIYSSTKDAIDKFYELLLITAERDGFDVKPKSFFYNLLHSFKDDIKVYFSYKDDIILSSSIFVVTGNIAYFLYGASSNLYRNFKATYLLQFEMIKEAIDKKCEIYNMGGTGKIINSKEVMLNGLIEYKRKFGSISIENTKCYDIYF